MRDINAFDPLPMTLGAKVERKPEPVKAEPEPVVHDARWTEGDVWGLFVKASAETPPQADRGEPTRCVWFDDSGFTD